MGLNFANLADHHLRVIWLAMILAKMEKKKFHPHTKCDKTCACMDGLTIKNKVNSTIECKCGVGVNFEKIMMMALVHEFRNRVPETCIIFPGNTPSATSKRQLRIF